MGATLRCHQRNKPALLYRNSPATLYWEGQGNRMIGAKSRINENLAGFIGGGRAPNRTFPPEKKGNKLYSGAGRQGPWEGYQADGFGGSAMGGGEPRRLTQNKTEGADKRNAETSDPALTLSLSAEVSKNSDPGQGKRTCMK